MVELLLSLKYNDSGKYSGVIFRRLYHLVLLLYFSKSLFYIFSKLSTFYLYFKNKFFKFSLTYLNWLHRKKVDVWNKEKYSEFVKFKTCLPSCQMTQIDGHSIPAYPSFLWSPHLLHGKYFNKVNVSTW
jgi:hypothetical protein